MDFDAVTDLAEMSLLLATPPTLAAAAVTVGTDGVSYINAAHYNGGVTTLTGTAQPGDSVTVVDRTGRSVVGPVLVNPDGTWSATVSGLTDGRTSSYVATATDAVGNTASSRPLTLTVDITTKLSITTPTGSVNPATTISGTIDPEDVRPGATVQLFDNGGKTPIGIAKVAADGAWSTDVILFGRGAHSIVAKQTDAAGNLGSSTPVALNAVDQPVNTTLTGLWGFPGGGLVTDAAGNLYGTTSNGGDFGYGTAYVIARTGTGYAIPVTLFSFNGANGSGPNSSLIADAAGNLFGTTSSGGAYGFGTIFEIAKTADGYAAAPTTLVSLSAALGSSPSGNLIVDASGNLIGLTTSGGLYNRGTVFQIAKTADGYASTPTVLVNFDYNNRSPNGLIADASGNLFVTTASGKVFEIVKTADGYAGTTILYNNPSFSMTGTMAIDGNGTLFYAVFSGSSGSIFKQEKGASGYQAPVQLTFASGATSSISGDLIIDANGNLFGTTSALGADVRQGTVFKIAKTATGYNPTPVTLATFNGSRPVNLSFDSNGNLFGTTDIGTAFEVTHSGFVPAVTIAGIQPGAEAGRAILAGTASGGLTISIYSGSTLLGTTMAAADGSWSFGAPLAAGDNNFSVSTIDAAGRQWKPAALTAKMVSGGTAYVSTPTSTTYFVQGAGALTVAYGATIAGLSVGYGGIEYVSGLANATSVLSGGIELVTGPGTANESVVSAGGVQNVMFGGTALSTTVKAGGFQSVRSATVSGTQLFGNQQLLNGGTANATTIGAGGGQYIAASGTVNGTIVNNGGRTYLDAGGTMNATTVNSGGFSYIAAGATESGAIINSGGVETVLGTATGTAVKGGGLQEAQGHVFGTTVAANGSQRVGHGGTAGDTMVDANGFQLIDSGGIANGTTLNGYQQVLDGGTAVGTVINANGNAYVGSGGASIGTVIARNGRQYVDAGATDTDSVAFGGVQYVGGTATRTTIDAGGEQDVGVGGMASDSQIVSGTQHVYAGGLANDVDFDGAAAGTLILDDPSLFSGTIAHFGAGDRIDFRDVTSAAIDGSGHLTMTAGGNSYSWALMGQYAAADFSISGDGVGGTVLSYQPAETGHTVSLVSHV